MVGMRRSLVTVVMAAVIAPLALSSAGDERKSSSWVDTVVGVTPAAGATRQLESATVPIALALTPAGGKKNVPVRVEIGLKVSGAEVTRVTLKDGKG
jgi:hypothetical protein